MILLPLWRYSKSLFHLGIKDESGKSRTLIIETSENAVSLAKRLKNKFTTLQYSWANW